MQKRRCLYLLLVLLLGCLFPPLAQAAMDNTLVIHKVAHTQEMKDLRGVPEDGSEPIAGALYRIWHIGPVNPNTDQAAYNALLAEFKTNSVDQLDARFGDPAPRISSPTDSEGITTFAGLADGRYYVREVNPKTGETLSQSSLPFIIDLPYFTEKGAQQVVEVYPKGELPPDEEAPEPLGGERFRKVDEAGNNLAGAKFKLLTQVTDADGRPLRNESGDLVYAPYLVAGKEHILTADANGRFEVTDLPYGQYWLIETVSPVGYTLLSTPLAFEIHAFSYEDDTIFRIINKKEMPPPVRPDEPKEPMVPKPPQPDAPAKPSVPPAPSPNAPQPPGQITPESPSGKPPVTIPKTGDVRTYLFLFSGFFLVLGGSWLIRRGKA